MKKRRVLLAFLAGALLGAVGGALAPSYLGPRLPAPFRASGVRVEGPVAAKRRDGDRLLLTVSGQQGAVLVTVRHRIEEVDLLVEVGDSVALLVPEYGPFVTDPAIASVFKRSQLAEPTAKVPRATRGPDAGEPSVEGPAVIESQHPAGVDLPADTVKAGRDTSDVERDTLEIKRDTLAASLSPTWANREHD
jgi:hypothetical protein